MENRRSCQSLKNADDEVKRSIQRTNDQMLLLQKMAQESMNRMSYFMHEVNETWKKTFIQRNEEIDQILKYRVNQIIICNEHIDSWGIFLSREKI